MRSVSAVTEAEQRGREDATGCAQGFSARRTVVLRLVILDQDELERNDISLQEKALK